MLVADFPARREVERQRRRRQGLYRPNRALIRPANPRRKNRNPASPFRRAGSRDSTRPGTRLRREMLGLRGELGAVEAVGKYRIVLPLGQGGTADVYLAVAEGPSGFQKLVVVKVLRKSLASDDDFRQMFLSEARLAARLHHPNVVQTNEVGRGRRRARAGDGVPRRAAAVAGDRARQAGRASRWRCSCACWPTRSPGCTHAHELADFDGTPLGVVHRDVSPHNVFVTLDGHAKVLDFGIAKLERSLVETEVGTSRASSATWRPSRSRATSCRPARRHLRGGRDAVGGADRRADVEGVGRSGRSARACWQGDLPTPETARPEVPAALARICRRALARAPGDRHATARQLGRRAGGGHVRARLRRQPP